MGCQLAQSMCKNVEMTERGKSVPYGFLCHLRSIMDGLSKQAPLNFQTKTIQSAYEMLAEEDQ